MLQALLWAICFILWCTVLNGLDKKKQDKLVVKIPLAIFSIAFWLAMGVLGVRIAQWAWPIMIGA